VHTSGRARIDRKHTGLRLGEGEIGDSPGRRKPDERRRKRRELIALMRGGMVGGVPA
jgi:hypothetical protein